MNGPVPSVIGLGADSQRNWPLFVSTCGASDLRFSDATRASGVAFSMTCGKLPSSQILEVNGGGVALFDYDDDGDLDLFLANGATLDDTEHGPGSRWLVADGCDRTRWPERTVDGGTDSFVTVWH